MKLNRLNTLLSGILAGALLMALAFGFAVSAAPKATQADSIIGTRSITLESQNASAAGWVYSDAVYTQFYGTASCFSTWIAAPILVGAPVTMTNVLQASADASNWVTVTAFTAQTAAGTILTTTSLPGAYLRNLATMGNANPITFSVKCVLKNSST
jgi:hypothetical protein